MKKLLLSVTFIVASISVNAQTTVLEEDFQNFTAWPDANWVQHNIDGYTPNSGLGSLASAFTSTAPWGLLQENSGNLCIGSTSWFSTAGAANRWITSPAIDLTSYTSGIVTLTYKSMSADGDFPDGYKLYVSTTGTAVADFGTTAIHQETAAAAAFTTQTVDLSAYLGQTIHLGWQHDSNDMFIIILDDIKVVYKTSASSAEFFTENFNMYPNPVTDVLNIESKNGLNANEIKITDMTGKVIKVQKDVTSVNVSDLSAGTYLIDITTNEGKATSKFIKR